MVDSKNIDSSVLADLEFNIDSAGQTQSLEQAAKDGEVDQATLNALADQERTLSGVRQDLETLIANMRAEGLETGDIEGQLANVAAAYQAVSGAMANPTAANVSTALATGNQAYNKSSSSARTSKTDAMAMAASMALTYNLSVMAIEQAREIAFFASDTFASLTEGIQNLIMPEVSKSLDENERKEASLGELIEDNPELKRQKTERIDKTNNTLDTLEELSAQDKELADLVAEVKDLQSDANIDGSEKNFDESLLYLEELNDQLAEYEKAVERGESPEQLEARMTEIKSTLENKLQTETQIQDAIVLDALATTSLSTQKRIDRDIRMSSDPPIPEHVPITNEQRMEHLDKIAEKGISIEEQQSAQDHLQSRYPGKTMEELKEIVDRNSANWNNLSDEEKALHKLDRDAVATAETGQILAIKETHQKLHQTRMVLDNDEMLAGIKEEITQGRADGTLSAEKIKEIAESRGIHPDVVKDFANKDVDTLRAENTARMEQTAAEAAATVNLNKRAMEQIEKDNQERIENGLEPIRANPDQIERVKQELLKEDGAKGTNSDIQYNDKNEKMSEFSLYLADADIGDYDLSHIKFEAMTAEETQAMLDANEVTLANLEEGTVVIDDSGKSEDMFNALNQGSQKAQEQIQHSNDFAAMLKGESFSDGIMFAGDMKDGQNVNATNAPAIEEEKQVAYQR